MYFKQMDSKLSKQGQIALIFLIIVASLLNISLGTDTKNYWLGLMGTCLTYLVPIQKLKEYGLLEKSKIYYNPKEPASFSGPIKLYRKSLKDGRVEVTYDAVRKWLQEQDPYTLHKQRCKPIKRKQIIVEGIDRQWDID